MAWMTLNLALIVGFSFYALTILIHTLVIYQVIDYTQVNGGRSTSYKMQKKTSVASIMIALVGAIYLALNFIFPTLHETLLYGIFAWILTAYWVLGYILQWLGTPLEKYVISWVLILGIISHGMLGALAFF